MKKPKVKEQKSEKDNEETEKDNFRISIAESKIKKLVEVDNIEELFHILTILKDEDIEKFLEHYKGYNFDKKMQEIIKNSNNGSDFIKLVGKSLVGNLKQEYESIMAEISKKRKKGSDLYMEDIKSMSIPLKIRIFEATLKKEDFYNVKKLIHEVKNMLELIGRKETK